jgi:DNA-binding transcriptional MerR regulator
MHGYLRIGELAKRTGLSPELLRAWEMRYGLLEPSRSKGGFRLYSDLDVARVLRTKDLIDQGLSAAEAAGRALAVEPLGDSESSASRAADLTTRLSAALDVFDEPRAHAVIDELFSVFSVETGLRDVVLPYLARLGDRWASGEVSIGQEHFASNVIRGRMSALAGGWGWATGPALLLACPPGEEHELGLMAFGIVAARRGWRVVYLGPNTPFETIEASAREVEPTWIVLAVSSPARLQARSDELRSLASVGPVAVGGAIGNSDVEGLQLRLLDQDPVTAATTLTV